MAGNKVRLWCIGVGPLVLCWRRRVPWHQPPWILWEVCVHSHLWWSQDILCCSIKSNNFCIHAAAGDVQGEKVCWELLLNMKPPLGPGDWSSWAVLVWCHRCQWCTCCKSCSLQRPLSQTFPELYKWKNLPNHWLQSLSHLYLSQCTAGQPCFYQ